MKKQVASWIVAGALVVGIGAAFAEGQPSDPGTGSDPTTTTTVAGDTTTTVAEDTTTTVAEDTTTTVADGTTTTVDTTSDATDTVDATSPTATDWPGNSWAAQNHDCDELWGNHGAWVAANAKARKTGDEVPCDPNAGQATTNTSDQSTTSTTVAADTTETTVSDSTVTQQSTTRHGNGGGHGTGHGKKG